jgi:periplasmic protein CpxP/Spy
MRSIQWKAALATVLIGLCSVSIFGQSTQPGSDTENQPHGRGRRGGGPDQELNFLTRLLTLTTDQQTGVKALLDQQSSQIRALRTSSQSNSSDTGSPEARQSQMTQMQQIRDETNTKISALLDDTQKQTFADWLAKRKAAMGNHQSQGGNSSPPDSPGGPPPNSNQ